jgi:hypothetical protein
MAHSRWTASPTNQDKCPASLKAMRIKSAEVDGSRDCAQSSILPVGLKVPTDGTYVPIVLGGRTPYHRASVFKASRRLHAARSPSLQRTRSRTAHAMQIRSMSGSPSPSAADSPQFEQRIETDAGARRRTFLTRSSARRTPLIGPPAQLPCSARPHGYARAAQAPTRAV